MQTTRREFIGMAALAASGAFAANTAATANAGESNPADRPVDVARPQTVAVWALGIPPVDENRRTSNFRVLATIRSIFSPCAAHQQKNAAQSGTLRKRLMSRGCM